MTRAQNKIITAFRHPVSPEHCPWTPRSECYRRLNTLQHNAAYIFHTENKHSTQNNFFPKLLNTPAATGSQSSPLPLKCGILGPPLASTGESSPLSLKVRNPQTATHSLAASHRHFHQKCGITQTATCSRISPSIVRFAQVCPHTLMHLNVMPMTIIVQDFHQHIGCDGLSSLAFHSGLSYFQVGHSQQSAKFNSQEIHD